MQYRIMEVGQRVPDSLDGAVEIGAFDSAYHALEVMKQAQLGHRKGTPPNWYLVDGLGQILAGPDDVIEAVV
jgi:hypothetical protein